MLIAAFLAVVVGAVSYFLLKADRVASNRIFAYAAAFALVFLGGALVHRQFTHGAVADSTRLIASAPADGGSAQNGNSVGISSLGALDSAEVDGANNLHVRGWALGANGQLATKVIAIVDGTSRVDISSSYGRARPDVASAIKKPGAKNSGYDGSVPIAGLTPGDHNVRISVVASDRTTTSFPANSTRTFAVR